MKKSVQLPFIISSFANTQGEAAAGLALENHPTGYNQILNQCVTMSCTRRFLFGYTTPKMGIPRVGVSQFACLEKYNMDFKYIYPYYKEILKQLLDEGFYVYYNGIDDFYLPEKTWYGIRHLKHDGIICGYDEEDKTYSVAAYDINWIYRLIRIPQDCFDEGLRSGLEISGDGRFLGYRMKDNISIKLDEKLILKYLKEHLNGTVEKFSLDSDGPVVGIATHNFYSMYIDKLEDGSIPTESMDWRALRSVWEHKKCMYDRILAIESLHSWNNDLSEEYKPLIDLSNRVRIMYAMYHKNNNKSLLPKIKKGLLELGDREKTVLEKLVARMEEVNI